MDWILFKLLSVGARTWVLIFGAKYILGFTPNGENGENESSKMLGCSLSYTQELEINPEFLFYQMDLTCELIVSIMLLSASPLTWSVMTRSRDLDIFLLRILFPCPARPVISFLLPPCNISHVSHQGVCVCLCVCVCVHACMLECVCVCVHVVCVDF